MTKIDTESSSFSSDLQFKKLKAPHHSAGVKLCKVCCRGDGGVYLVGAGQPQSVEDGDENVCWDEQAQEIGAAEEPILGPKGVDLWRRTQDGHGRLEGGQQGQWDGQAGHGAVGHQEFLQGAVHWSALLK